MKDTEKNSANKNEHQESLDDFLDNMFVNTKHNYEEHKTNLKTSFYPLPAAIKDEIAKHVNNIKRILKDDQEARDYMLKQLLSAYTDCNIKHEMNKWVHNNYDKSISHKNYNDLLSAVSHICPFIQGCHPLILKEVESTFLSSTFNTSEQQRLATWLAVAHEFIMVSDISVSEVKALGEVYEDMI